VDVKRRETNQIYAALCIDIAVIQVFFDTRSDEEPYEVGPLIFEKPAIL